VLYHPDIVGWAVQSSWSGVLCI